MYKLVSLMIVLLLAGCATTKGEDLTEIEIKRRKEILSKVEMTRRFVSLRQIHQGMSKQEVKGVLGHKVITGYELSDPKAQQYRPLTVDNPYRSEIFQRGTKKFEIDYYIVGIKQQDDKVSDNELVPLVFKKDRLIGIGWDYLNEEIMND